ncbi:hypothetical protein EDB85DRAFT_2281123 [Lactarius pseudohatsudake]|nr:hypothetical protein EDB85DRAFT_2281123 [Lactarius pseudohatsudake]
MMVCHKLQCAPLQGILRKAKATRRLARRGLAEAINHGTAFECAARAPGARPTCFKFPNSSSKRNVVVNADTVNLILLLLGILAGWRKHVDADRRPRGAHERTGWRDHISVAAPELSVAQSETLALPNIVPSPIASQCHPADAEKVW